MSNLDSFDQTQEQRDPPCGICGGPCLFDTVIPSPVWNQVIRANELPEYLCAACIIQQFAKRDVSFACELWGAEFNGLTLAVHVNNRRARYGKLLSDANTDLRRRLSEAERACERLRKERDMACESILREVTEAIEAEHLEDPTNTEGDVAYDAAIAHALDAVAQVAKRHSSGQPQ